jgi:hypothetical protein
VAESRLLNLRALSSPASFGTNQLGCLLMGRRNTKGHVMRMITGSLVALAVAGVISGAATAVTPAAAQGVYIQGPGFGVDIGRPAYRGRYYHRGYRDYDAYAYSGRRHYRGQGYGHRRWRDADWD